MAAYWVSFLPRLPAWAANPAAPLSPPAPFHGCSSTLQSPCPGEQSHWRFLEHSCRSSSICSQSHAETVQGSSAPQAKRNFPFLRLGGHKPCCSRDKPLAFAAAEPRLAVTRWASLPSSTAPCHLLPLTLAWKPQESPQHLLSWACFADTSKLDLDVHRGTWCEVHHSSDPCLRLNRCRVFVILPGYSLEAGWNYWECFLITWVSHFPTCVVFLDRSPVRVICAVERVLTLSELPMVLLA